MAESSDDTGALQALMHDLHEQRLPRARELKSRIDRGERLGDPDLAFLATMLADARSMSPLVERNPEYRGLVAQALELCSEIAASALANEQRGAAED